MVKRVAVFAAFDANGKIHRYVQTYLKELKKIAQKIIFVCDNDISAEELKKIDAFADAALRQKHGEYDFGSYKRGIAFARENRLLENADELILCNDSCFCLGDLSVIFNCSNNCDFYGATQSTEVKRHLQSYFMVFKKNVFSSEAFVALFKQIEKKSYATQVVYAYELSLTALLEKEGFCYKAYIPSNQGDNPTKYPVLLMQKHNFPFLKRKCFLNKKLNAEGMFTLNRYLKKNKSRFCSEIAESYNVKNIFFLCIIFYIKRLFSFLYQKHLTSKGKILIKVCKIPVFSWRCR